MSSAAFTAGDRTGWTDNTQPSRTIAEWFFFMDTPLIIILPSTKASWRTGNAYVNSMCMCDRNLLVLSTTSIQVGIYGRRIQPNSFGSFHEQTNSRNSWSVPYDAQPPIRARISSRARVSSESRSIFSRISRMTRLGPPSPQEQPATR